MCTDWENNALRAALVDGKMDVSQQCALVGQKANSITELHQKKGGQQGVKGDCPPLLRTHEAPSGAKSTSRCGAPQHPLAQGAATVGPEECHEDD